MTAPSSNTDAGRLWGGRFAAGPDQAAWQLGVSTHFDAELWREDIAGSRAHAGVLHRLGILDGEEHRAMLSALDECGRLFQTGEFPFEADDEDVHGAIERWLRFVEDCVLPTYRHASRAAPVAPAAKISWY